MKTIKYRDPLFGDINIDLESDEYPKSFVYVIFIAGGVFFCLLGALCLAVMGSLLIDYYDATALVMTILFPALAFGGGFLCFFGAKKCKKKYYEIREKLLQQEENRAHGIQDDSAHLLINTVEIGTNLMGWVRGIDTSNNLTPVTAKITFTNHLGKEIKYLKITLTPHNKVNDPVSCTVSDVCTYEMTGTGPFSCGCSYWLILDDGWYNNTIETVVIEGVEAIYTDGSSEVLSESQIKYANNKKIMSDNDSRYNKRKLGTALMVMSTILDFISIIGIFTLSSEVFGAILFLSTAAFIVSLQLRR